VKDWPAPMTAQERDSATPKAASACASRITLEAIAATFVVPMIATRMGFVEMAPASATLDSKALTALTACAQTNATRTESAKRECVSAVTPSLALHARTLAASPTARSTECASMESACAMKDGVVPHARSRLASMTAVGMVCANQAPVSATATSQALTAQSSDAPMAAPVTAGVWKMRHACVILAGVERLATSCPAPATALALEFAKVVFASAPPTSQESTAPPPCAPTHAAATAPVTWRTALVSQASLVTTAARECAPTSAQATEHARPESRASATLASREMIVEPVHVCWIALAMASALMVCVLATMGTLVLAARRSCALETVMAMVLAAMEHVLVLRDGREMTVQWATTKRIFTAHCTVPMTAQPSAALRSKTME